jgi:tetratricopeptide (TPR) repeat protein
VDLFKKKSNNGDGESKNGKPSKPDFTPDPRKARKFFDHAQAVADTRNYDYAIECYVQGLRHDPEAMDKHEALREVALKRKVNNGKPAGMFEKSPVRGKTTLDKMLAAEYLWSKDPLNPTHALAVMENAVASELYEVGHWVGDMVLEANQTAKRPSKQIYIKARDLYAQMEVFDKAVDACRLAVAMDSENPQLVRALRDLEAENTLQRGGYSDEGDFRKGIRDAAQADPARTGRLHRRDRQRQG